VDWPIWVKVVVAYLVLAVACGAFLLYQAKKAPFLNDDGTPQNPTPRPKPSASDAERQR
jgi:hypothetical protein